MADATLPILQRKANGIAVDLKKSTGTMKALVYNGPGKIEWKDVPKPNIEKPTDVVVKMTKTTICGTDLGILHGKTPSVKPGTSLGHEGVGSVEEVGAAVRNFKIGDHVIISCITSDGTCMPMKYLEMPPRKRR